MIYKSSPDGISSEMLEGFFVDWPNPPSPKMHLKILRQSRHAIVAFDDDANRVIGFITAISDGVLSAYIPFLEVLPSYQKRGIGKELVKRMLEQLSGIYMIDLCCDDDLVSYYEAFGMVKANGMITRNYERQSGT